jgi:hypothetical protein
MMAAKYAPMTIQSRVAMGSSSPWFWIAAVQAGGIRMD